MTALPSDTASMIEPQRIRAAYEKARQESPRPARFLRPLDRRTLNIQPLDGHGH